jgi:hypothetical protein
MLEGLDSLGRSFVSRRRTFSSFPKKIQAQKGASHMTDTTNVSTGYLSLFNCHSRESGDPGIGPLGS